jgi:hypothetical protein
MVVVDDPKLTAAARGPRAPAGAGAGGPGDLGLAARCSLREQIAQLEERVTRLIVDGFPYIEVPAPIGEPEAQPRLLSLDELERLRDRLVARVQGLEARTAEHKRNVAGARELLERMKREPGRYKFTCLPVKKLGEGGCGAWMVRPRFGPIGMIAGWWHVKLSSGCPLAEGRAAARPASPSPTVAPDQQRANGRLVRMTSSAGQRSAAPCGLVTLCAASVSPTRSTSRPAFATIRSSIRKPCI